MAAMLSSQNRVGPGSEGGMQGALDMAERGTPVLRHLPGCRRAGSKARHQTLWVALQSSAHLTCSRFTRPQKIKGIALGCVPDAVNRVPDQLTGEAGPVAGSWHCPHPGPVPSKGKDPVPLRSSICTHGSGVAEQIEVIQPLSLSSTDSKTCVICALTFSKLQRRFCTSRPGARASLPV